MYHYLKFTLTPVMCLITIASVLAGGHWMWLGIVMLSCVSVIGDFMLGDDPSTPEFRHKWILEIPFQLALPFLVVTLVAFAWACGSGSFDLFGIGAAVESRFGVDILASRAALSWSNYLGGTLSVGYIVALYGTNMAHELTHRTASPSAMFSGRWLLSMSCNPDFAIEHVYGHHVHVGTDKDPATAKRGENVYSFFVRSSVFGHLSAWHIELARLEKRGYGVFSWHNQMIRGYLMTLVWVALFAYAGGGLGVGLFLGQAFIAKFLLEATNYMEHYGLRRNPDEPVRPEHSWNTNKRASGIILYTLTRHSAHHEQGNLPFYVLDPYVDAPQMMHGYLGTLYVALVPPIWQRMINPRLELWDAQYENQNRDAPEPVAAHVG